jgi:uridine kinase
MLFTEVDQLLFEALWWNKRESTAALFELSEQHPITKTLLNQTADVRSELSNRLQAFVRFLTRRSVGLLPEAVPPSFVWDCAFPLAQWIYRSGYRVVGIAGPAGAGKTTLAQLISLCLSALYPSQYTVCISLDDLHFPRQERIRRSIKWRATPGSHDIGAGAELIKRLKQGEHGFYIPRYSSAIDDIARRDFIRRPPSLIIFEGWFVGKNDEGYEALNELIDSLVFLECPLSIAKHRRFARAYARLAGEENELVEVKRAQIQAFWDEVLEPGYRNWVMPIATVADVRIGFDMDGEIQTCIRNDD